MKHVEYRRTFLNVSDEYKLNRFPEDRVQFCGFKRTSLAEGVLDDARKALPIIPDGTKTFFISGTPTLTVFDSAYYDVYSGTPVIQNTERNPLLILEKIKAGKLMTGTEWWEAHLLKLLS